MFTNNFIWTTQLPLSEWDNPIHEPQQSYKMSQHSIATIERSIILIQLSMILWDHCTNVIENPCFYIELSHF